MHKLVTAKGVKSFDQTRVTKLKLGQLGVVLTHQGHQVKAKHILVATNSPINDKLAIHDKQASYRTYVIGAKVPKGSVCKALYWDTANSYHYILGCTVDLVLYKKLNGNPMISS